MMKKTFTILILLGAVLSASAMRSTNTVSGTVDTRDYTLEIDSPYGSDESFPSLGIRGNYSWRSTVYCSMADYLFEQDGTILRNCIGFYGEGISPGSGAADSVDVVLTNVNSTLTWNWNTAYWVTRAVSGQGGIFGGSGSAGWYNEGQSYLLKARPDYGWLFTGWSGGASGGPSATNLNFTATAPTNLLASFSDDPDGDGLKNTNEWAVGANPWMADTDGDNFDDLFEFNNGLSPTVDSSPFVTHIQDNPDTYGLYSSNVVLDVAIGQALFQVQGTTARLNLQLEQSDDLKNWTDAGDPKEWELTLDPDKKFFRVRSE
ncbi:MAG: hypothetical protein K9M45_06080 [Kiritimatiellales bacterium]|nr:hypothetical protein [Kiritimatiellales bacterium]